MRQRIARAERAAQQQPRNCATCSGWPAARIVYANDSHAPDVPPPPEPEIPERCSACRWEPLTVVVRYADDWRAYA